ncbi:hypothetical protein [Nocardioides sp.]|uniref:hypothetical protein n=1 Tax=Nocardioides sp. TaxID=35761 RepID=UPI00356A0094
MDILVNTDSNVDCDAEEVRRIEADLRSTFDRFDHRVTRIEVHLSDESAGRETRDDTRCLLEARPSGMDPVVVRHHATGVDEALSGATDKLMSLLTKAFDRRTDREHGRDTIRGH